MIKRDNTGKATASLPHKYRKPIDYSKIHLVNPNTVLFVWVDELEESFTHSSGLVIARTLSKERERFGVVVKTNIADLQVGEYIVVSGTHEPFGCVINSLEHWMSSLDQILYVTNDKSVTETYTGDVKKIDLKEKNRAADLQTH